MKIQTKYYGEIEIDQSKIIEFEQGIPSFLDEKRFYIFPFANEGPFYIMQSVKTPGLAFVIINPFDFFKDYSVKLSDQVIEALKIDSENQVAIFTTLTIQEPFENTTTNLQGPIIINDKKMRGKQVILTDTPYKTKHLLTSQLSTIGKEG